MKELKCWKWKVLKNQASKKIHLKLNTRKKAGYKYQRFDSLPSRTKRPRAPSTSTPAPSWRPSSRRARPTRRRRTSGCPGFEAGGWPSWKTWRPSRRRPSSPTWRRTSRRSSNHYVRVFLVIDTFIEKYPEPFDYRILSSIYWAHFWGLYTWQCCRLVNFFSS